MTIRPASGFVTSTGKFYETKFEARRAEATTELIQCIQADETIAALFTSSDPTTITYLIDHVLRFINAYSDQIKEYVDSGQALQKDIDTIAEPPFQPNPLQDGELVRTVSEQQPEPKAYAAVDSVTGEEFEPS